MSTLKVDNVTNTAGDTTVNSVEIEDSGWIIIGSAGAPAFQNNWVDYGTSTYFDPRFRKINGVVYIEGLIKNGTTSLAAFTLPVGYRPYCRLIFATDADSAFGRLDVNDNGDVLPIVSSNAWVTLNCSFVAHQ